MSRALIASTRVRPMPGHPKTLSTNTDPATTPGSARANRVTSGGSALASTWRHRTRATDAPLARAVRTHGSPTSVTAVARA